MKQVCNNLTRSKQIILLIIFTLIIKSQVFASSITDLKVVVIDKTVIVSGIISSGEGKEITVLTVRPSDTGEPYSLDDIKKENIKQIIAGIVQKEALSGPNGEFEIEYKMNENSAHGWHQIWVGGTDIVELQGLEFYYATDAEKEQVVKLIKEAKAEEMEDILKDNNHILQLDLNGDYKKLEDKMSVYEKLEKENFNSIQDIRLIFEREVKKQRQAELEISTLLDEINNANWSEMGKVLAEYNYLLKLDLDGVYKDLFYDDLAAVHRALAGKNFDSIAAIRIAFNNAMKAIQYTPSRGAAGSGSGSSSNRRSTTIIVGGDSVVEQALSVPERQTFNDIASVMWAKESIETLAAKGIIDGVGNNMFKPNDLVTREQFIKMLVCTFGQIDESAVSGFNDLKEGAWYYPSIPTYKVERILFFTRSPPFIM